MKKHVYSLMMVLALVVLAGTNAFAADGDLATTPAVHLPGSTHPVSITLGSGGTVSWVLYSGSTAVTTAPVGETVTTWPQTATSFNLVWSDLAAGSYYLEATETDDAPLCAVTKRGFHLYVLGFDALVYTSNASGSLITGASLLDCSESRTYPVFMNDITKNLDGTARGDGSETLADGNLADFVGTNPRTTRYFTVEITFDAVPGGMSFSAPDLGSIVCDIATTASSDLYSINSVTTTPATLTSQMVVEDGTTPNIFVIPAVFNDRWGTDITAFFDVTNIKIFTSNDGTGTSLGEEPSAYEDVDLTDEATESPSYDNNRSATYTIQAAPNTSVITVTP